MRVNQTEGIIMHLPSTKPAKLPETTTTQTRSSPIFTSPPDANYRRIRAGCMPVSVKVCMYVCVYERDVKET